MDIHPADPPCGGGRPERAIARVGAWVLLSLLFLAMRVGYLREPLIGIDETGYMVVADVLARGGRLYADVWDQKPPVQYLLYLGVQSIAHCPEAIHAAGILLGLANTLLVLSLGRRLFGWWAGLGAAWLYNAYTASFGAVSFNSEVFLVCCQLAAVRLLFSRAMARAPAWTAAGAGVLLGLAFMNKYVVAFPIAAIAVWLAVASPPGVAAGRRRSVLVAFAAGLAAVAAACLVWCAGQGVLGEFFRITFGYNARYAVHDFWRIFLNYSTGFIREFAATRWFLILAAAAGAGWLALRPRRFRSTEPEARRFLFLWLAGSALAVAGPLKFLDHYFQLIIPVLALLAGALLAEPIRWRAAAAGLLAGVAVTAWPVATAAAQSVAAFAARPGWVAESGYEPARIGRWLARQTPPDGALLVWAAEIDIYFYARRDPAARFFWWPQLLRDPLPAGAPEMFFADLERRRPRFVVEGDHPVYALLQADNPVAVERFERLWRPYLARHYVARPWPDDAGLTAERAERMRLWERAPLEENP